MVIGRSLSTGCASCRLFIFRRFVLAASPSLRTSDYFHSILFKSTNRSQQLRRISHLLTKEQGILNYDNKEIGQEKDCTYNQLSRIEVEEPLSEKISTPPWYLKVESSHRTVRPFSERQIIPSLPESPPPILEPLLQHVSIGLGLDNLSLLDLRKLDPPPALGANLLMLIGTTRSERHLHVSADRLCRWLRSTYRLRPDADGLVGRNQLKLKLKRKAKRAKLLGGNDESADDGIRSGWVCIDLGTVEAAEGAEELAPKKDFIGFGRRSEGVRIVVQMLTEEKREEIELEKLWGGILRRRDLREAEIAGAPSHPAERGTQLRTRDSPRRSLLSIHASKREYHTCTRRLPLPDRNKSRIASIKKSSSPVPSTEDMLRVLQVTLTSLFAVGDFDRAKEHIIQASKSIPQLKNGKWKSVFLNSMLDYLRNLPRQEALPHLGTGDEDRDSTSFLRSFHRSLSVYPSKAEAAAVIGLLCHARGISHPGYSIDALVGYHTKLSRYVVRLSRSSYLQLLHSVLDQNKGEGTRNGLSRQAIESAALILETMNKQGFELLDEDMLIFLQEMTCTGPSAEEYSEAFYQDMLSTFNIPSLRMPPMQERLHLLMLHLDLPLFREQSRMRLLRLYAEHSYWTAFWDIFRMPYKFGEPQSASLYAWMFSLVARTKNQRGCIAILRTWLPELEREDPAISLTNEIAGAVKACLLVVYPDVESISKNEVNTKNEWISIWQRFS